MGKNDMSIRVATPEDAADLVQIYAPYVQKTAITFEYDVPTAAVFRQRILHTLEKYPYFVAEIAGRPVGYAYAGPFQERQAYDWAVEVSIYVSQQHKKQGIGRRLYDMLERTLQRQGFLNANACIAYPKVEDEYLTQDSIRFHQHMGYTWVGEFTKCGYKFDRWYDMVWMEKEIGRHHAHQAAPIPFSALEFDI